MRTDILTNIDHASLRWHDCYHHYHSHPSWHVIAKITITIFTTVTIILVGVSLTSSPSSPSPSRSWHVGDSYRLNSAWQPGPSQVMLSLLSCHHHHHHHHHKMGKVGPFEWKTISMDITSIHESHSTPLLKSSLITSDPEIPWPPHYHLHHDWLVVSNK